ncbi:UNVERIFIED_CONTAM: hypothetical protein Cloal_4247 [Acetivibrio alkalicellulosi]
MTGFYVSIMFIGILLILTSLILIAFEKKKELDGEKILDDKKKTLASIIIEAEQMIEELNRISDYIVSQFEQKKQEVVEAIENADKKVKFLKDDINCIEKNQPKDLKTNAYVSQSMEYKDVSSKTILKNKLPPADKKVIPLNNKHKEVIDLSTKGLNETQIAKKLSMGKGEIQLILGMSRGQLL